MKKTIIDHMVNRFLMWKLPENFAPDCGISFNPSIKDAYDKPGFWPVGTNLLTAGQAREMVKHMLSEIMPEGYETESEGDAYMDGYFDALIDEATK